MEGTAMIIVTAWAVVLLGIAHTLYGLVRFKQPIEDAVRAGFVGQFAGIDSRRLAFWFTIVGPLLVMGGQVALHAAHRSDLELLKIVGTYMLVTSATGVLALPKSPFWIALALGPVFVAGGYGWLAL
jgi:hypothetical protein